MIAPPERREGTPPPRRRRGGRGHRRRCPWPAYTSSRHGGRGDGSWREREGVGVRIPWKWQVIGWNRGWTWDGVDGIRKWILYAILGQPNKLISGILYEFQDSDPNFWEPNDPLSKLCAKIWPSTRLEVVHAVYIFYGKSLVVSHTIELFRARLGTLMSRYVLVNCKIRENIYVNQHKKGNLSRNPKYVCVH